LRKFKKNLYGSNGFSLILNVIGCAWHHRWYWFLSMATEGHRQHWVPPVFTLEGRPGTLQATSGASFCLPNSVADSRWGNSYLQMAFYCLAAALFCWIWPFF